MQNDVPPHHYDETYYSPWEIAQGDQSPWRIGKNATFASWLRAIARFTSLRGSLLDIGCAAGCFLEIAVQQGWDAAGVEISSFAAAEAKKRFGGRVFYGTLHEAHYDDNRFDAITAFDVIEHLDDPVSFINEIGRIIKPGGLLALSTADSAAWSCRILGKRWPQFKPEHCSYFSLPTIDRLLRNSHFEILHRGAAGKRLTIAYIDAYFRAYPSALFGPLFSLLPRILPKHLRTAPLRVHTGELFVIARRTR
ncbi:MAG: class I SAM-dependent methyltransferase [Chitinispirillaceae bacterium]|nr:class I SAM-dependent methyltransferase [Chitinispirillaceae bacterium]